MKSMLTSNITCNYKKTHKSFVLKTVFAISDFSCEKVFFKSCMKNPKLRTQKECVYLITIVILNGRPAHRKNDNSKNFASGL